MLTGLARDGGLYVPEVWPQLSAETIADFFGRPYWEVAVDVIKPFAAVKSPTPISGAWRMRFT